MDNRMKVLTAAVVVLALGLLGALWAWNAADEDDATTTADGTTTATDGTATDGTATDGTADDGGDGGESGASGAGEGEGSSTSAGARATTSAAPGAATSSSTSPRSSASTTTSAVPAPELPAADPDAPPTEPLGVYRDGTVTLGGSVPTPELAAAYQRKVGGVIGEENVTMAMTLDPRVSGTSLRIDVDERFQFPVGSAAFDPQFEALLNLGVAALQLVPESTLIVTGHTDDIGDPQVNEALSLQRAQIVVDFMTRGGIPAERVIARGAGESEPIADNATPEGRQENRRIEATLEGVSPE